MRLTKEQIVEFQQAILEHYVQSGRHELPWRLPEPDGQFDAYKIWVSELMLQQTQVSRVIPKYQTFLQQFPDMRALATAPLGDVLIAWQGLGYNRRAKYLWQAAQLVVEQYGGALPNDAAQLMALPGIGRNTAGAIMSYAFNRPAVFIETNIRTVYFHEFFGDRIDITDRELLGLLEQTIDRDQPRQFYWALMDYGSFLKQQGRGGVQRSKHYTKQSRFEGSARQVRGRILRLLAERPWSQADLLDELADERALTILDQLEAEGMITKQSRTYCLA